jgi:hypothetical protein
VVSKILELFPGSRIIEEISLKPEPSPPEPEAPPPATDDDEVRYSDIGDPYAGDPEDIFSEDDL